MVKLSAIFLTATAALVAAAPTTTNIFQDKHIFKRDVNCRDDLGAGALASVPDSVACINYLAGLGNQPCVASVSGTVFCRRGQTQITGISILGQGQTATSSCNDVARGAGQIMDKCTRGDGTVRGANAAWGNGNLIVDIRRVP
ncbi:hypothetical protein TWF694_008116 [Orbilia ellipsospora]|uniref:Cyanovirin-N domain-containing protein n=1 Tax=Orbilia ellipsospora TaxID=2528407 RepID=A0AAV9XF34_9PEZI